MRKRKYPKTNGYWVYCHQTPDKMIYVGISKQQPEHRLNKSSYGTTALQPYIEQYGWENIEHKIIIDGLTKKQAYQVEDWFIRRAKNDGFCINKYSSGGLQCDGNRKAYNNAYKKVYYDAHREEIKAKQKAYRDAHRADKKAYDMARNSTTEGKIYKRVKDFNRSHPDRAIITPAEAKEMYLLTGYIPDFIKSDDLQ